jgi:hypothetical protein
MTIIQNLILETGTQILPKKKKKKEDSEEEHTKKHQNPRDTCSNHKMKSITEHF